MHSRSGTTLPRKEIECGILTKKITRRIAARSRAMEKYRRVGFFKIKITFAQELTSRSPWEFNARRMGANPLGLLSRRCCVLSMSIHIYRRCDVQWRAERTGTIIQCGFILIKRRSVSRRKNLAREKIVGSRRWIESKKCSERIPDGTKILASLVRFDAQSILLIELTLMIML